MDLFSCFAFVLPFFLFFFSLIKSRWCFSKGYDLMNILPLTVLRKETLFFFVCFFISEVGLGFGLFNLFLFFFHR